MPRVAFFAEDASSTVPVVPTVEIVASVLIPPVGGGRGSLEVLHFDSQGL